MNRNLNTFLKLVFTCATLGLLTKPMVQPVFADSTWAYTVQINAAVQSSPPQISLSWPADPYGAISYTLYRKSKDAMDWGSGLMLPGSATSYLDTSVADGSTYEYALVKSGFLGYTGYGYIYSGIRAPLVDSRGKIILVVATNSTAGLSNELKRLETDLAGDGWTVLRHDVSSNQSPASVRSSIITDYYADPANVRAVFLFGHVPILHSGNLDYDGHFARPMPADAYYGDVDGVWNNPNYLPSDVELMVGRVDFFSMPGNGAPVPWPSEAELLRNYLNKDHQWRHNLIQVDRRALMGNRRGDEEGQATAASGYRNFDPLVGHKNTVEANILDNAPAVERWISMLTVGNYLWAYGCGGGQYTSISGLGTHGQYFDVWSTDIVGGNARAVFVMVFGSYLGNWDSTDNIMRSVLATPNTGLACCMAGRPHWFLHHMGLGETIGYSTRLTMNNATLYRNHSNEFTRAVYIALMGDPTLRQDPVFPPSNLAATAQPKVVNLSWTASAESVAGYHVYRAPAWTGPFLRLTSGFLTTPSFTDNNANSENPIYMVRAVKLQQTPSGTYYNASQGVFVTVELPIAITVTRSSGDLILSWNSLAGKNYRVLASPDVSSGTWVDISGIITATGPKASWTVPIASTQSQLFCRVRRDAP